MRTLIEIPRGRATLHIVWVGGRAYARIDSSLPWPIWLVSEGLTVRPRRRQKRLAVLSGHADFHVSGNFVFTESMLPRPGEVA